MTLHAVQSAMKTLIVGGIDLPDSAACREDLYRELFPELSSHEVLDLAAISPHRLKIYTDSIFAAQGGILKRNFPCSVAMVEMFWPIDSTGSFSVYRLAQEVHRCAPWRGIHSESLGESFLTLISSPFFPPALRDSGALDMAEFELASLRIRKALSGGFAPQSRELFEKGIEKATVGELLALSLSVPRFLEVLPLSFDVIEFRKTYRENKGRLACGKRALTLVGARPADYGSAWHEVPVSVGEILKKVAQGGGGRTVAVSTLAEAYLPSLSGEDEAALFKEFMVHLGRLVEIGALAG